MVCVPYEVAHKTLTLAPSWRKLGRDLDGDYFLHFSDEEVNTCEITDLVM
jgi:hypothetical protein